MKGVAQKNIIRKVAAETARYRSNTITIKLGKSMYVPRPFEVHNKQRRITDVGKKRSHNEDAFAIHQEKGLFIMCDGMGGHASGEVASQLAVDEIARFFIELCRDSTFDWPYELDENRPFNARALERILYANDRIFVESMKNKELEGMGTTVCAMATAGSQMAIAHVGDSRVYRYRDNTLTQLTEDHSLINHYRRLGELSEEDLEALGKKKNVIVRALGLKDEVEVDVASRNGAWRHLSRLFRWIDGLCR